MSLDNLTRELISIDSVTGKEDSIIQFIHNYLKKEGYKKDLTLYDGGLIAGDENKEPVIALVGHVDTVPISNKQKTSNESNMLYGRGAVDMKSGLSVMIKTLINYQEKNIIGVFYKGEEGLKEHNGLETLFPQIRNKFSISFGIIFEPTNNEVQLGCQGVINAELKIKGVEAHSARPWLGENAIYKSIPVLEKLRDLNVDSIFVDDLEYKEVVNVTTINGGNAKNVIPGELTCGVNYRFSPDKKNKDAIKSLTDLLSEFGELLILDIAESAYPNKDHESVQKFINLTGVNVEPKQAWTDIARFTQAGIAAVNFGPGDPEFAHKADENISVSDINNCYSLVENFIQKGDL